MTWLEGTLNDLESNQAKGPVFIIGFAWPCPDREMAALALIRALAENTSATSFVLQDAEINSEKHQALAEMLHHNTSLQMVNLRNLSNEQQERYAVPAEVFQSKTVHTVSLKHCHLDFSACKALGSAIRDGAMLTTLTLDDVTFDKRGKTTVIASLCLAHNLKSLTLKNINDFDQNDTRRLSAVLGMNRSIESLFLEDMATTSHEAKLFANHVAHMVARNRWIHTLSLRSNFLSATALRILAQDGLAHNQCLSKLLLSRNPLGEEGAEVVMDMLKGQSLSSKLRHICLALTQLDTQGCCVVAKNLALCPQIKTLILDGNNVEQCGPEFLAAMDSSYHVVHLFDGLSKFVARQKRKGSPCLAWQQVQVLLQANRAKRRFLAHADTLPRAVAPYVLESAATSAGSSPSSPDVLYLLLQNMHTVWPSREAIST